MRKESITAQKALIMEGLRCCMNALWLTCICCLYDTATQNFDSAVGKIFSSLAVQGNIRTERREAGSSFGND